jgi:hypothetical protein
MPTILKSQILDKESIVCLSHLSRVHYKSFLITTYLIFFALVIFLMKTLIEVNGSLWGKVKDYATVKDLSLYSAVERLLLQALIANGYSVKEGEE